VAWQSEKLEKGTGGKDPSCSPVTMGGRGEIAGGVVVEAAGHCLLTGIEK